MRRRTLLALAALAACAACIGETQAVTTRALVYEVDLGRLRTLGWAVEGASDAELIAATVATLKRRLPFGEGTTVTGSPEAREIHIDFDQALPDAKVERIAGAVGSLGLFEILIVPRADQLAKLGVPLPSETFKLEAWRAAHPEVPLGAFNLVSPEDGGPDSHIVWLTRRSLTGEAQPAPVLVPTAFERTFGVGAFERVYSTADSTGFPALGFEMTKGVRSTFEDFTADNVDRQLAMVVHDTIVSAPTVAEPLPGVGIIAGRWDDDEVKALAAEFQSGEGPLRRLR